MPTSRSYGDACGIARALDVVGERWALLVVRELLFGPQRFSDLRRGLPGASSNLVADRLRELTARGVVQRRKLAPPAGSWVYELTEWGRELDPVIVALGNWGLRVPLPDGPVTLGPVSVLLYLRTAGRPAPGDDSAVQIDFDGRVWTARTSGGQVRIEAGAGRRGRRGPAHGPGHPQRPAGRPGRARHDPGRRFGHRGRGPGRGPPPDRLGFGRPSLTETSKLAETGNRAEMGVSARCAGSAGVLVQLEVGGGHGFVDRTGHGDDNGLSADRVAGDGLQAAGLQREAEVH